MMISSQPVIMTKKPAIPETDQAGIVVSVDGGIRGPWTRRDKDTELFPQSDKFRRRCCGSINVESWEQVLDQDNQRKPELLSWGELRGIPGATLTAY
jgi:hypothetical protein